jgi:hypothetical protein
MKSLKFVGSSLDDLRDFPAEARRQAGFELYTIQRGFDPTDWKLMQDIGAGVREIRIHVLGEWRVLYSPMQFISFMRSRKRHKRPNVRILKLRVDAIGKLRNDDE